MFTETNSPSEICAAVEAAPTNKRAKRTMIASSAATGIPQPRNASLRAGDIHTDDGHDGHATHLQLAVVGSPLTSRAKPPSHTITAAPDWSSGHIALAPYDPAPNAEVIDEIINKHRLRQGMIKAQTKLVLQAMATIRFATHEDGDYDSDEAKAKARKKADDLYRKVAADPTHPLYANVAPYLLAMESLEAQRAVYEKELVKLVKRLPVYDWVKSVKGFGDISFATIVGECGDIGTYRGPACLWKRMGLAVFDGKRQGAPGEGASKEDWILHGYNKQRRSVSWNARNNLIGGMGKYRPMFGEDVEANPDLTYLQKVFVGRVRIECEKLGLPVTESDKGKESYKKHPTNRAMRYTEKRLLRNLWIEWRRH